VRWNGSLATMFTRRLNQKADQLSKEALELEVGVFFHQEFLNDQLVHDMSFDL
jgi:hypothetical protein